MVHDRVWVAAGMEIDTLERKSGKLCIGCLEKRLGRTLYRRDFTKVEVNALTDPYHTPRLRDRLMAKQSRKATSPLRRRARQSVDGS